MNRIYAPFLCIVSVSALLGCGQKNENSKKPQVEEPQANVKDCTKFKVNGNATIKSIEVTDNPKEIGSIKMKDPVKVLYEFVPDNIGDLKNAVEFFGGTFDEKTQEFYTKDLNLAFDLGFVQSKSCLEKQGFIVGAKVPVVTKFNIAPWCSPLTRDFTTFTRSTCDEFQIK